MNVASDSRAGSAIDILAVVGPTASGKSSLALSLAERLNTEIISADSMQIYRGMEIGTAAPTPEERARVRHHFVGVIEPGQPFSAGAFQEQATPVARRLNAEGKIAVVAGGSGLYVRALIDGLFRGPGGDRRIRERLHREAETDGVPALYARLQDVDPAYAEQILPGDLRRIVRALEVYEVSGAPLSAWHARHQEEPPPFRALQVGLDWEREQLYARIDARVDAMLAAGFVEEVRRLLAAGYEPALHRIRSLGYREMAGYLRGEMEYEQAVEAMKRNTRRFARRQLSWFRNDERIRWLPVDENISTDTLCDQVLGMLSESP